MAGSSCYGNSAEDCYFARLLEVHLYSEEDTDYLMADCPEQENDNGGAYYGTNL
jgi:hypothetical protein